MYYQSSINQCPICKSNLIKIVSIIFDKKVIKIICKCHNCFFKQNLIYVIYNETMHVSDSVEKYHLKMSQDMKRALKYTKKIKINPISKEDYLRNKAKKKL